MSDQRQELEDAGTYEKVTFIFESRDCEMSGVPGGEWREKDYHTFNVVLDFPPGTDRDNVPAAVGGEFTMILTTKDHTRAYSGEIFGVYCSARERPSVDFRLNEKLDLVTQ